MTSEVVETQSPEESIAKSIVPYNRDDSRARYLGLRSCGFAIREALKLIGNGKSALSMWRRDPQFVDLENRIPEFKKALSLEYAGLEFMRNLRLVFEKDYRVLTKSLLKNGDAELTTQEQAYLLKMRAFYTPQQLQVMEALVSAESTDGAFNFTSFI
ncbi:unnamed protein product, partial [marine sediment metagenome]